MSQRFAVVHEAAADFHTATELADRVLVDSIDWLDEASLEYQRIWLQESGGVPLTWKTIKGLARDAGIVVRGHFDGQPAEPDAHAARRAILYLRLVWPDLAGVMLIRDQDDEPERREGLEQARRHEIVRLPVVVGLAIVERESWVLSGFDPQDDDETSYLEAERQKIGFDPRLRSHELTACKNDQAARSAKRVLRELCHDDRERERRCWRETLLTILRDRGADNGLVAFLNEVRDQFATRIGHVS